MISTRLKQNKAFTLAEVLITLGIIGVVAAMTIPTLLSKSQDMEYKTAYKKAYADFSQAFSQAIFEGALTPRGAGDDDAATASEWAVMKEKFKVVKNCDIPNLYGCWADADRVCTGACLGNSPNAGNSSGFVDASGRSWAQYYHAENIYLVDTNGLKPPNKFGKDRWMFTLKNQAGRVSSGLPTKVGISTDDKLTTDYWCTYAPCYYRSWLYE